jgi:hypothetical protein
MEPDRTRGVVISLHALGAAIRLEDGRLASASAAEVDRHRAAYGRSLAESVDESVAAQAAQPARLSDAAFELQIANYLKETESWAPADRPAPLERHLFRKKLRAKAFQNE